MFEHRFCIDLYEREVLFFIFCRTGMYDKEEEVISLRDFMEGIRNTTNGQYVASPVAISKTKLLDSLRHLEAKRIIEVTRAYQQKNKYRIRKVEELDIEQIMVYMEQNQNKQFRSLFGRLHRRDNKTLGQQVREHMQNALTWSKNGLPHSPNQDQPHSPNLGHIIRQTINKTDFNLAAPAASRFPRPLRKVKFNRG